MNGWKFLLPLVATIGACPALSAPPLETFGRLPGVEDMAISPSGDRVAIIGVVDEQRRVIVLDRDNKPMSQTNIGTDKVRWIQWADENKLLIRVTATAALEVQFYARKFETGTVLVYSADGTKAWPVLAHHNEMFGPVFGPYAIRRIDGHNYGYFGRGALYTDEVGAREISTAPYLYRVDLDSGSSFKIADRVEDAYRKWLIGVDGKIAATLDFNDTGHWTILNQQKEVVASGDAPRGDISLTGFGRTPASVLYATEFSAADGWRWFEQPLAGGKGEEVLPEQTAIAVLVDPRTQLFSGYVQDTDVPEDHFYDPHRERVMAAARKAFPGLAVKLIDWNDGFDKLVVRTDGPGDPQSWWKVDIKTGAAVNLGVSYPMPESDVGPMRMYGYKAVDGLAMAGVLTLPPDRVARNLPVIVLPHSGPTTRDYPVFDWLAQAFASRGYAVFQPNFRGSTGSGAAFRHAGDGQWGRKMQTDISDGLAALVHDGIVDPKRACIVGEGYGGYAALAGVTVQQGVYRCAVAVAGIADVSKMFINDVYERGGDPVLILALKRELGSGTDMKQISPITFASRADAPILLVHGTDDTVVAFAQSSDMAAALKRAGKPYEFVTLPSEDHWLSKSETRLAMLKAAVAFVEKYDPPDPAPAPAH